MSLQPVYTVQLSSYRSFDSPQYSDVYTQHSCEVLCARYSPSGFYIASADKSGKVRIWDTVNAEHILKNEYQVRVQ